MLKTNKERLVMQSVQGAIQHPRAAQIYRINLNGGAEALPATGAICYNVEIGDSVFAFEGDHIEPGVTTRNSDTVFNTAYMFLSCIGNEAKVISGDAKGKKGYVTGTHGGVDHTMIYFPKEVLEDLNIGDKIAVKGFGQGLKLLDYESVRVMTLDPSLLDAMGIEEGGGKLHVPVTAIVPPYLMGSGIGGNNAETGDYDIMCPDETVIEENGLQDLKFGDFVFLQDCDTTYGRGYLKGSGTVGVVIHGACIKAGHGPGITTVLTAKDGTLVPKLDKTANIQKYIKSQYK